MSNVNPPSSVPGSWKKDTPANESENPVDKSNVPRTGTGVVSETGEILDSFGKGIGKIADSKDPQDLVGNTVTATGDIVNSAGSVLGRAVLNDDDGNTEYTTDRQDDQGNQQQSGGLLGKTTKGLSSTVGGVGKTVGGLTNSIGLGQQSQDGQSETPQTEVPQSEAPESEAPQSEAPESEASQSEAPQSEAPQSEAPQSEAGETEVPAEGQDKAEDALQEGQDAAAGGVDLKDNEQEAVGDKLQEGQDQAQETAEEGQEKAQDTTEEGQEQAQDIAEDGQEKLDDKTGEALDKTDEAQDKAEEGQDLAGEGVEGAEGEVAKEGEDVAQEGEDAAKEGDEAVKEGEEAAEDAEKPLDFTILKNAKVNKAGNLVNDKGEVVGRLTEGEAKQLIGMTADEEGNVWNASGKQVGKAEPIPDAERGEYGESLPFENFPDAVVEADGKVTFEGKQVGVVVEGDPKKLKGSKVDKDGDIQDRNGNVIGKAEAWNEPEPEEEAEVDRSILAGKRVNKAGNIVDSNGQIFGRLVEGDPKSLIGRMCDKEGNVRSESGDVIGKAEVVPEGEREGAKEGPFAELEGCTVGKDGKVLTAAGDVVGRLIKGDAKTLFGRSVDEDGDVVDRNGNVLGKAERWEEPEVEKKKGPFAGRRVNKEGSVYDEDGNLIGKLISGDPTVCAGKEIDDDGDVINSKGNTIGHVVALEDVPPEPETESEEDKKKREEMEKDKELAGQLASQIEQSLDKIRPICKRITDKVDRAERTPKEELDEEELVKAVKPLLEDGGRILTETNGIIRGMDPDGRIQRNAKHKASTRNATPEEYHLADVLKELTGTVTETIDNGRRKIEDMPHAKKELNPLWNLLREPLFQILAAVGMLLNGVLGLVGQLLSGLGLGGLVDNLLGGLGLNKILDSLGLGDAVGSLTGKKKSK